MAPLDPDVELVPLRAVLEGGSYHGVEGLRRCLEDMGEDWERSTCAPTSSCRSATDRVLVMGESGAREGERGGGRLRAAWLCYLRAGKVVRVRFYSDREQALAAAGE